MRSVSLPVYAVALMVLLPVFSIFFIALSGESKCCTLLQAVIPHYLSNTFWLLIGTAIGVTILGGLNAVLITFFHFPARKFFRWALILPLAVPPYIVAFIYTDLLHYSGPVRVILRETFPSLDAYFLPIHSLGGAIFVFSFLLYPYLYLLLRVSLSRQATPLLEAARMLRASQTRVFFRIILPLTRSAILAGLALSSLEVLNDYGAVSLFSLRTLSTGIYEIWWVSGNAYTSSQIAIVMLGFIMLLLFGEYYARGERKVYSVSLRQNQHQQKKLTGIKAVAAFMVCFISIAFGFLIPFLTLIFLSLNLNNPINFSNLDATFNSIWLGLATALITVMIALMIAYISHRFCFHRFCRIGIKISQFGYAIPGTMIAIGLIIPLAAFDNWSDQIFETHFNIDTGLILSGGFFILILAYMIRFFAPAFAAIYASMEKITPSMDEAAETLGKKRFFIMRYLHLPLLQGGVWVAGLIVFVETIKELPATLLLRPFNFDTLAIRVYEFAADEAIEQAAPGALVIVLISLIPVLGLSNLIGKTGMESSFRNITDTNNVKTTLLPKAL